MLPRLSATFFVAIFFLVHTTHAAEPINDKEVFFYGEGTTYENKFDLVNSGRVVIINKEPTTCNQFVWQAKLIEDQSQNWLAFRQASLRRISAKDLVFFQFKGLSFRIPYSDNEPKNTIFYDPYELLGYLFIRFKENKCGKKKLDYQPDWPFGKTMPPATNVSILPFSIEKSPYQYLESLGGYPTDVYFCKKKVSAADLEYLQTQLKQVYHAKRLEDSGLFRKFTKLRESICGES